MEALLTGKVDRQSDLYSDDLDELNGAGRYQSLSRYRDSYLQRARDCSRVTIPTLIPDDGDKDRGSLRTPYQSLGARGVNYLASKLLITLFPPNQSFFKLTVDSEVFKQAAEAGVEAIIRTHCQIN